MIDNFSENQQQKQKKNEGEFVYCAYVHKKGGKTIYPKYKRCLRFRVKK